MKVAFTSSDGTTVDRHFGMATEFHLFEIGPGSSVRAGTVAVTAPDEDREDGILARADAIAGCAIVFTTRIGGPAAAKLIARRIQPMATGSEVAISDLVGRLQEALCGNPPPWIRKAMSPACATSFLEGEDQKG